MSNADVARALVEVTLLLGMAHMFGSLFARFRQPRVIGEIVGGLVLGPTLFGAFAPGVQAALFPLRSTTTFVLGTFSQIGLLLLMFCSGTEVRSALNPGEGRTVASIAVTGMALPFLAGLGLLQLIDQRAYWGPAGNSTSFLLVFGIAVAVTSVPVISRIMFDLGILDTAFARLVLGVAVVEDITLYVVLAIALGYAQGSTNAFGVPSLLGLRGGSVSELAYHVMVAFLILGIFLGLAPRAYRAALGHGAVRTAPVTMLLMMLAAALLCMFLGIEAFFGAFLAGVVVGSSEETTAGSIEAIKGFSFGFFIPIYFALVGLNLDLAHGFGLLFFVVFFLFACSAKALSVYLGARLAGEPSRPSWNLAVALNARGGPGIVLASVAYGAKVINQQFYAVLVLLAVLTSLLAGSWLERIPKERLMGDGQRGRPSSRRRVRAREPDSPSLI